MEKYSEFETCSAMISHLIIIMFFENCLWNRTPYRGSHLYALLTHVTWFLWLFPRQEIGGGTLLLKFYSNQSIRTENEDIINIQTAFSHPTDMFFIIMTVSAVRLDIDSLPINRKIPFFDLLGETEGTELFYFSSCISFPQASPDWGICSLWVSVF